LKRDFFGYLPYDFTSNFDGGRITPVSAFGEATAWVKDNANKDGFIYPPIEKRI